MKTHEEGQSGALALDALLGDSEDANAEERTQIVVRLAWLSLAPETT